MFARRDFELAMEITTASHGSPQANLVTTNWTGARWARDHALYIGATANWYVAPGAGGTQNGYTPSTMAIWARLPVSGEVIAETPGNAFYFDGQTYINIPDNNSLDLVADYTIEAWINVIDNSNNTIIDKGDYRYLFQAHANNNPGLGLYRSGQWIYSQGSIPINEWVHGAVSGYPMA